MVLLAEMFMPSRSLEALGDISKRYSESLHSWEGILKVQYVRVPVDPSELHHLDGAEEERS